MTDFDAETAIRMLAKMITPGQVVMITPERGGIELDGLKEGLADFGMGSVIMTEADVVKMSESELMDRLDDIRIADKVLLLSGYASPIFSDVSFTVHKHFVRNDGKAVFIVFPDLS